MQNENFFEIVLLENIRSKGNSFTYKLFSLKFSYISRETDFLRINLYVCTVSNGPRKLWM